MRVGELSNLKIKDSFLKNYKDTTKGIIINGKGGKTRPFYVAKNLASEL